jgi:hypothetical protein
MISPGHSSSLLFGTGPPEGPGLIIGEQKSKAHVVIFAARTRKVSDPQMFRNQAKSVREFKGHFAK